MGAEDCAGTRSIRRRRGDGSQGRLSGRKKERKKERKRERKKERKRDEKEEMERERALIDEEEDE